MHALQCIIKQKCKGEKRTTGDKGLFGGLNATKLKKKRNAKHALQTGTGYDSLGFLICTILLYVI
jgi:hypothetical protein